MIYAFANYSYYTNSGNYSETGSFISSFFPSGIIKGNNIPTADDVANNETNYPKGSLSDTTTRRVEYLKNVVGVDLSIVYNTSNLATQSYSIKYYFSEVGEGADFFQYEITYYFAVFTNKYPLKKWTITDVVNRCFDTLEAQKYGEKPRFRFDGVTYDNNGERVNGYDLGSQAEYYDKILSPEFSFTKMHAREMLKQVGGFIHGEPRITNFELEKSNGKLDRINYTVAFDKYGSKEYSHIKNEEYFSTGAKTDINEFCTGLDSSADNLISQLNYAQGVVIEPVNGGVVTLRSESSTVRLGEDNSTIIKTSLPIYMIGKEKTVLLSIAGKDKTYDITPYVFEKADYDNLSGYDGVYPYSKSFALYYEQGQPNIKGLFFKSENAVNQYLSNYAIVNIIRQVSGDNSFNINIKENVNDIQSIAFRVTYLPIFSTRVKTNKELVVGGIPRQLAYNQSANMIESRFYGENLKGVVSRLGNPERTYTYHLAFLSEVPKVGMLFDDNHYISAVSTEITPSFIKCTIAVSKDFNRLSQYVGINSNKRMWEVSEKMSQDRSSIRTEYIMVSQNGAQNSGDTSFRGANIADYITNYASDITPISNCAIKGYSKNQNQVFDYEINLPVVATAIGNSMLFVAKAEDNYSAGQKIGKELNGTNVAGYWGEYVPYGDYYGRAYYYDIGFVNSFQNLANANTPKNLPVGDISASKLFEISKWRYRKDSREACQFAYELQFVTDDKDIIIGSSLAENCCLVNLSPKPIKCYALPYKISKLDKFINIEDGESISVYNSGGFSIGSIGIVSFEVKSIAIVTEQVTKRIDVEDENGEQTKQDIVEGGELILGYNLKEGETSVSPFFFGLKSNIYK